ncbi:hypothetical protein V2J09_015389 [Rumex salicifolius]
MDPPTLMNETSFPSANGAPYNFSEIWPYSINGGCESSGDGRLELRRPPFAADMSRYAEEDAVDANPEAPGNDSITGVRGEQRQRGGSARRRKDATEEAVGKSVSTSSANPVNGSDHKRVKTSGSGDENQSSKADGEGSSGKGIDQGSKSQKEPPKDYIHVRARRGQATDSHSLAERARREKISERMKLLQDLVPGCNKVIGKALVLDEIINYIQSLQRQVEFLSMKLETVNTRMDVNMEGYPAKDFEQPVRFDPSAVAYGSQGPREYNRGSSPEWLHMQVGSGFQRQS